MSAQSGIDFRIKQADRPQSILETIGHGVALIDADGDGLLDIVFVARDQVRLYKNLGGFKFRDITGDSGLRQPGLWGGLAVGDYDNDGRPDLLICGYDCTALYHNEGGGRFREVTVGSGLEVHHPAEGKCPEWRTSAGFVDYDNDGKLDLLVCRYADFGPGTTELCSDPTKQEKYSCSPDIYHPQKPILFHNEGGGRFTDVTSRAGLTTASGRALGVAFGDYNDDGLIDIAIANDERPGDLFLNLGGGRFINKGYESGTALNALGKVHGGMGIDWGDFNGDGKPDLFVTTYENEAKNLYRNLDKGQFMDSALDSGLAEKMDRYVGFGTKFLDYDRDGRLDLIVTNGHVINNTAKLYPGTSHRQPVLLFHNDGGTFSEVTSQLGAKAREPIVGRGLAVGDLDNDGKLDVVIVDHDGSPLILRNATQNPNHWISIRLAGTRSNRSGFGARVTLRAGGMAQMKDSTNAGSYMSASDSRLYFGLGKAQAVDLIEVRWPGGKRETLKGLPPDRFYEVTEGKANAPVSLPPRP